MLFRRVTPYLYLIVPLVLLVAFFFWPLAMAFRISMLDYGHDLYAPAFVGMENYARLVDSAPFWNALRNTFVFLIGVVPAMVVLPIFVALLLNGKLKGVSVFRSLIYIPVVISMVVVGIAWKWLYATDGLINYFLSFIGLPKVGWLVDPDIALYAVMAVVVWKGLAYYMMMYLAHLQNAEKELYEAAKKEGKIVFYTAMDLAFAEEGAHEHRVEVLQGQPGRRLAGALLGVRRNGRSEAPPPSAETRMFRIGQAIGLAALIAGVLVVSHVAAHWLGPNAALATAFLTALAELQAATATVATLFRDGTIDTRQAQWAVVGLVAASSIAKSVVAFVSGGRAFGLRITAGLLAATAAAAAVALLDRCPFVGGAAGSP